MADTCPVAPSAATGRRSPRRPATSPTPPRADGLVRVRSDGCGPYCSLALHAPLPAWLHTALAGTHFGQPERGWPNFARSGSPVDWPALIEEHPECLVVNQDCLDAGAGAQWSGIVAAYRSLDVDGYRPYFDADLGVSEDGRISVEPMGLLVECSTGRGR